MKAKDIKIGDELYSNTSQDWAHGAAWNGRRVVVMTEVGHWYHKDGGWVKSSRKIEGFRYQTRYGVVVRETGATYSAVDQGRQRVVTLGSLRGTWAECDAVLQASRQRKTELDVAVATRADAKRKRNDEVIAQAADLGISGWPYIGTDTAVSTITISPEILSQMLDALKAQGWTLPLA